jgi:hypothetical protein
MFLAERLPRVYPWPSLKAIVSQQGQIGDQGSRGPLSAPFFLRPAVPRPCTLDNAGNGQTVHGRVGNSAARFSGDYGKFLGLPC